MSYIYLYVAPSLACEVNVSNFYMDYNPSLVT